MEPLFGTQTPTIQNGDMFINFFISRQVVNPRTPLMGGMEMAHQRVMIKKENGYNSIEDILNDQILIKPNINKYSINTLARYVAIDTGLGLGVYYDEYGVVAYSGKNNLHKPIAKVMFEDGDFKFYPSPDIAKMVKKV